MTDLSLGIHTALRGNRSLDINSDPDCSRTTDSDRVLSSSWGLDVTVTPGSSKGHPDKHGPRWWSRPQESAWPSMVTGATNINTDPDCGKTKNPDTAPNCIPGLDVTTAYATRICMAPAAVRPSDTDKATGYSPDPRLLCDPQW